MSKISNSLSLTGNDFPHLTILRNDESFKTELDFVNSVFLDTEKMKAVIRYAFANERMLYVGFHANLADDPSAWEEESIGEDVDVPSMEKELTPANQWEKEAVNELEAAQVNLEQFGITTQFVQQLKVNGTTLEEIFFELKKEKELQPHHYHGGVENTKKVVPDASKQLVSREENFTAPRSGMRV